MTPGQTIRLNTYVALCLDEERPGKRAATIDEARAYAHSIGIPPDEIEAAVDAAIKNAEAAVS